MYKFILFFLPLYLFAEVEFVIVSPSYNNALYVNRHLDSIRSQTYPNWKLLYINDCSEDKTGLIVEQYILRHNLSKKCHVTHNRKRQGAMANFYSMIHSVPSDKVIVHVDGDDALAHPRVLELLAKIYEDPNVWVTYGNYRTHPFEIGSVCKPFPDRVSFRKYEWTTSHLKTYYAGLFQKIKKKDFQHKGAFFSSASDVAIMLPILEMATTKHIKFIPEILYIYNMQNPIRDDVIRRQEVVKTEQRIRKKKRYKAVKRIDFFRNSL